MSFDPYAEMYGDKVLKPSVGFIELPIRGGTFHFDDLGEEYPEIIPIAGDSTNYRWLFDLIFSISYDLDFIEYPNFSSSWSLEHGNVYVPDEDWVNNGLDSTGDVSNQITSGLPLNISTGAYIKTDMSGEGFAVEALEADEGDYVIGKSWIKVISGDLRFEFLDDEAEEGFDKTYSSASYGDWTSVYFSGRVENDSTDCMFYMESGESGGAEFKTTGTYLRYSLGAYCVAYDADGNKYFGSLYGCDIDGGIFYVLTDEWEGGYEGVDITRLFVEIPQIAAMWDFNETEEENVGEYVVPERVEGYNGLLSNFDPSSGSFAYGLGKKSLEFDGSDDFVVVGLDSEDNDPYFDWQRFTIEAIVNCYGDYTYGQTIIGKRIGDAPYHSWWLYFANDINDHPSLFFEMLFDVDGNPSNAVLVNRKIGNMPRASITKVAVTWDGRFLTGYVGGDKVCNYDIVTEESLSSSVIFYETRGTPSTPKNNSIYIGAFDYVGVGESKLALNGTIDEIRMAAWVRTHEEIGRDEIKCRGIHDAYLLGTWDQCSYMSPRSFFTGEYRNISGVDRHLDFGDTDTECRFDDFSDVKTDLVKDTAYTHESIEFRRRNAANPYPVEDSNYVSKFRQHNSKLLDQEDLNFRTGNVEHRYDFNWEIEFEVHGRCLEDEDDQFLCVRGEEDWGQRPAWKITLEDQGDNTHSLILTHVYSDNGGPLSEVERVMAIGLEEFTRYCVSISFIEDEAWYCYVDGVQTYYDTTQTKIYIQGGKNQRRVIWGANRRNPWQTLNGVLIYGAVRKYGQYPDRIFATDKIKDSDPAMLVPQLGKISYDPYSYGMFLPLAIELRQLFHVYPMLYSGFSRGDSQNIRQNPDSTATCCYGYSPIGTSVKWKPTYYGTIITGDPDYYDVEGGDNLERSDALFLSRYNESTVDGGTLMPYNDGSVDNYDRFGFNMRRIKAVQFDEEHNTEFSIEMLVKIDSIADEYTAHLVEKWTEGDNDDMPPTHLRQWSLTAYKGSLKFKVSSLGSDTPGYWTIEKAYEGNMWHYIVITYISTDDIGRRFNVYVDGKAMPPEKDSNSTVGVSGDFDSVTPRYPCRMRNSYLTFGGYYNRQPHGDDFTNTRCFLGELGFMNITNHELSGIEVHERYLQMKGSIDRFNNIEPQIEYQMDALGEGL